MKMVVMMMSKLMTRLNENNDECQVTYIAVLAYSKFGNKKLYLHQAYSVINVTNILKYFVRLTVQKNWHPTLCLLKFYHPTFSFRKI